jgi:hypothetical protein
VKFSSVVSIQIFSLKNANPSINKIHVENDYFPLPSKFEMLHLLMQVLLDCRVIFKDNLKQRSFLAQMDKWLWSYEF